MKRNTILWMFFFNDLRNIHRGYAKKVDAN